MENNHLQDYLLPGQSGFISAEALMIADKQTQMGVMREWFMENFETPEENTPYDSQEGGYIYIWGGPFDAKEQLENEFTDIVPEALINDLAEVLNAESAEWAGKPSRGNVAAYFVNNILEVEFYDNFKNSILNITKLLGSEIDPTVKADLYRLLYANIITALESYLSDAFINTVFSRPGLMRKFVETNPDFQKERITISEIYQQLDKLRDKVKDYLGNVSWHNLSRIKQMYKETLEIDFPEDLKELFKAIVIRHDIVHRNGKTKNGSMQNIELDNIKDLIIKANELVAHINYQLALVRSNSSD